jgi:hypothetical protein
MRSMEWNKIGVVLGGITLAGLVTGCRSSQRSSQSEAVFSAVELAQLDLAALARAASCDAAVGALAAAEANGPYELRREEDWEKSCHIVARNLPDGTKSPIDLPKGSGAACDKLEGRFRANLDRWLNGHRLTVKLDCDDHGRREIKNNAASELAARLKVLEVARLVIASEVERSRKDVARPFDEDCYVASKRSFDAQANKVVSLRCDVLKTEIAVPNLTSSVLMNRMHLDESVLDEHGKILGQLRRAVSAAEADAAKRGRESDEATVNVDGTPRDDGRDPVTLARNQLETARMDLIRRSTKLICDGEPTVAQRQRIATAAATACGLAAEPAGSLGRDNIAARGPIFGDVPGDAFGHDGLGFSDAALGGGGGGGDGDFVGLDRVHGLDVAAGGGPTGAIGGRGIGGRDGPAGRKPRSPSLRAVAVETNGRLPAEVIQRVLRQQSGRLRFCYEAGLAKNPNLAGRVAVRFVIDRSGAVSLASDAGSDLPDAAVVSCVVRVVTGLTFPEPPDGIVTVTYPVVFSPGP